MKAGKTIIQIYSVWGMFLAVLLILLGFGMGIFSGYINPALTLIVGNGAIVLIVLGGLEAFVYYNLFKFKEWAKNVVSGLIVLGFILSMAFSLWLVIDVFLLYLMWMEKDTAKLFKK